MQLRCGARGGVLDDLRDLEVAALVTVGCLEHRHRADVADPVSCVVRSNRSMTRTLRPARFSSSDGGTSMPERSARSRATFSQAITFHVSWLALGNFAIAIRPLLSSTCVFGRAPPRELPTRMRRCRSARSAVSLSARAARSSNAGRSVSACLLYTSDAADEE